MATQQQIYQAAKPNIFGHKIDVDKAYGDQCVDVILYLAQKYFPGVAWQTLIPPVPSAKLLGSHHNDKYFQWIPNDHNDPDQLPIQGDFLVFDATPQAGYTNQTENPDGHTGALDNCTSAGYTLLMQDGTNPEGAAFVQYQPWKFRPCLGWLRPRLSVAPTPAPKPTPAKQTVSVPGYGTWTLFKVGSALRKGTSDEKATINLAKTGALKLTIEAWVDGKNAVEVNVPGYGQGVIWVAGTVAKIS